MTRISSPHNPQLKQIRRLQRRRERERTGTFLAEGEDLIAAAHEAGHAPLAGFWAAGGEQSWPDFTEVEPAALAAVSALGSGARVVGVYEQRWSTACGPMCVYLHGVRDPGNVGAVVRSALAFGAGSVALGPGCADPYGPKAVRASMGAVFAVTLARIEDIEQLPGERVALVSRAGERLLGPAEDPTTLLIGAEREGLPDAVVAAADRIAHIPIVSESLNAAMAATVALYEMTRVASP